MKKYLSVFMMFVRASIYPTLAWIFGLTVVQAVWFYSSGMEQINLYNALCAVNFDRMILITIVSITAGLSRLFTDDGGRMNNTLQRLSISEKHVYMMQVIYNSLIFVLVFLAQALTFLGLSWWYDPAVFNHQTIFVTAYQHPLFHTFFPLGNVLGIVTNLFLIAGLAICTAAFPFRQRRGKRSITTVLMLLVFWFYLHLQGDGDHMGMGIQVYAIIGSSFCMFISLCGVLGIEVDDYEEE